MLERFMTKVVPFDTERFFKRVPSGFDSLGGTAYAAKTALKI